MKRKSTKRSAFFLCPICRRPLGSVGRAGVGIAEWQRIDAHVAEHHPEAFEQER